MYLWGYKKSIENQSIDTIVEFVGEINKSGPMTARGLIASELSDARATWEKSLGSFDEKFAFSSLLFSHRTRNPTSVRNYTNVFFVRGRLADSNATIEVALVGQRILFWKLKSIDSDMPTIGEVVASCVQFGLSDLDVATTFDLDPPWIRYPFSERFSPNWSHPDRTRYIVTFARRWSRLNDSDRDAYIEKNPPPDEWINWYDGPVGAWEEPCDTIAQIGACRVLPTPDLELQLRSARVCS